MRRRPRIDLSSGPSSELNQQADGRPLASSSKDEEIRERKRKRWATVNKNRPPEENPFLAAIKPNHDNYGDPGESTEELRARLESLEFGNYPGYFNYRNKAATSTSDSSTATASKHHDTATTTTTTTTTTATINNKPTTSEESPLSEGLADERLRLMRAEWFRGKDVLDVGCNRGHVTYAIAKLFAPRFILGVDIDLKMINMANRDLHHHLERELLSSSIDFRVKRAFQLSQGERKGGDDDVDVEEEKPHAAEATRGLPLESQYKEGEQHFPLASYVTRGPLAVALAGGGGPAAVEATTKTRQDCDTNPASQADGDQRQDNDNEPGEGKQQQQQQQQQEQGSPVFPNNILFVEHNYVLSRDELVDSQRAHFDTIVCLSVTKWIHLNYRDEGLRRFFKRMHRHLKPGGLLVLEAQPFDNYHRKRKLSDRLRANFQSIQFKPEHFDEYLLGPQVGFRRILFATTTEHECAGFKRPMKVFLK